MSIHFSNNGLYAFQQAGTSGAFRQVDKNSSDIVELNAVESNAAEKDSLTLSTQKAPLQNVYAKPKPAAEVGKPPKREFGNYNQQTSHDRIANWAAWDIDELLRNTQGKDSEIYGPGRSSLDNLRERIHVEDQKLNTLISGVLKVNGINLGQFEKIDFSVNQNGEISVKSDGLDEEKRQSIEDALNRNPEVGQVLIYSQAQRKALDNAMNREMYGKDDPATERILVNNYLQQVFGSSLDEFQLTGESDELTGLPDIDCPEEVSLSRDDVLYHKIAEILTKDRNRAEPLEYSFDFSYMDGSVIHSGETDPQRIFNDSQHDLDDLAKLLGLGSVTDAESLRESLKSAIEIETVKLNSDLNGLFKKAGLDHLTRKVTFSEDREGNIVVEGNIRDDEKAALEKLVNNDPELVERLKTQKAKMEIYAEWNKKSEHFYLYGDIFDTPDKTAPPDLNSDSLASARKQLLKDYLRQNAGVDLDDIDMKYDSQTGDVDFSLRSPQPTSEAAEKLNSLLAGFKGIQHELKHYIENKKSVSESQTDSPTEAGEVKPALRQLMSMHRGQLSEAKEPDHNMKESVQDFRTGIRDSIVFQYNEGLSDTDSGSRIVDFTLEISPGGRLVFKDVRTKSNDPDANRRAESFMNKMVSREDTTKEIGKQIAEMILAEHDEEHGDTLEYPHIVSLTSDGYTVKSPAADAAARSEMDSLVGAIEQQIGDYFQGRFGLDIPFSLQLTPDGFLSFDAENTNQNIGGLLSAINERLAPKFPLDEDQFTVALPSELREVVEKLLELKAAPTRLHTT